MESIKSSLKTLPQVRPIRFSFDLVTTNFSEETNEYINDFVNNLGRLKSTNFIN